MNCEAELCNICSVSPADSLLCRSQSPIIQHVIVLSAPWGLAVDPTVIHCWTGEFLILTVAAASPSVAILLTLKRVILIGPAGCASTTKNGHWSSQTCLQTTQSLLLNVCGDR
jgi:hypothetical protein